MKDIPDKLAHRHDLKICNPIKDYVKMTVNMTRRDIDYLIHTPEHEWLNETLVMLSERLTNLLERMHEDEE